MTDQHYAELSEEMTKNIKIGIENRIPIPLSMAQDWRDEVEDIELERAILAGWCIVMSEKVNSMEELEEAMRPVKEIYLKDKEREDDQT